MSSFGASVGPGVLLRRDCGIAENVQRGLGKAPLSSATFNHIFPACFCI
jgi:hypothetical protein